MKEFEMCIACDQPTGRAGRDDDSLYLTVSKGPYCQECFDRAREVGPWEEVKEES